MANTGTGNFDAIALLGGANVETLATDKTLTTADQTFQKLDPGGAGRVVFLPAEETSDGVWFWITNAADAAENLTVNDDGLGTVVVLNQNEAAIVICNGTSWQHMGVVTIALS